MASLSGNREYLLRGFLHRSLLGDMGPLEAFICHAVMQIATAAEGWLKLEDETSRKQVVQRRL